MSNKEHIDSSPPFTDSAPADTPQTLRVSGRNESTVTNKKPGAANPSLFSSCSGYTLIELLAVMAIIAIIMAIAMTAYTSISRASAPRKAAENIESAISLARQYAVSRNSPVLFLFLDRDFNSLNAAVPNIDKYGPTRARHYAVFDPSNRVYVTGWKELPPGVVLDSDYPSSAAAGRNVLSSAGDMFYDRGTFRSMIPFPSSDPIDTNRLVKLPGIAFKSDGTVYTRTSSTTDMQPRRVNVAEGSVDAAGAVTVRSGGIKYGVKVSVLGHAAVEENP